MTEASLIIFVKKPELGKVKTRLAKSIGNEKALEIYLKLLQRTYSITQALRQDKVVYYTPEIVHHDLWEDEFYLKALQAEGDLGTRMLKSFEERFEAGYQKACIIGSDCYQLSTEILEQAFAELEQNDVVIGPSADGGYYLLGMKKLYPALFQDKPWSTSRVLEQTVEDIKKERLSCYLLPELTDVDEEQDLETMR
ncbi:TIGR04282 family arsenosugar biosynthesis glycosyltransferase [Catalinimonas niigatensis]|uniref:TIGR04282 family arsenosugar biosynthesis glycosyltransferase n=1 Tax=Catalinimonas niigatensis TaxID=1397264 RepID=UPI00266650CE|nr:TIGR04282 family arsenosugar biosynthesis glycosyltransferase [Catalinimonas niigatensis]WPP48533.1 TIGR04282 family arsenosugar biosynthesis glycosyltransferase [Catalinimonas niigatensis]